jgi:hypothetical protein
MTGLLWLLLIPLALLVLAVLAVAVVYVRRRDGGGEVLPDPAAADPAPVPIAPGIPSEPVPLDTNGSPEPVPIPMASVDPSEPTQEPVDTYPEPVPIPLEGGAPGMAPEPVEEGLGMEAEQPAQSPEELYQQIYGSTPAPLTDERPEQSSQFPNIYN